MNFKVKVEFKLIVPDAIVSEKYMRFLQQCIKDAINAISWVRTPITIEIVQEK